MGFHHHDFAERHSHLLPSTSIFTEAACAIYMGVVCVATKAYVNRVNTSKCRKVVTGDCFGMLGQLCNLFLAENKDIKACIDAVSAYVIPICNKVNVYPYSKFHGANMGPLWGRQDPGGSHVGPMNFAIWVTTQLLRFVWTLQHIIAHFPLHL